MNCCLKPVLVLCLIVILSSLGFSSIIHVPEDYSSIQEAIDAAQHGDQVAVSPGIYVENINFFGKAITVRSLEGLETTVIDGSQDKSVVTFERGEGYDSVLDGFSLVNGKGTYFLYAPSYEKYCGGGILVNGSSPTIKNSSIAGNSADMGGGIFCWYSSPIIENNLITGNTAERYGGGIRCMNMSSPSLTNNTIEDNTSVFDGGGISLYQFCDPLIHHNWINENQAGDKGGGIDINGGADAVLSGNVIFGNTTGDLGGGICCYHSAPTIIGNTLLENTSEWIAGGIACSQHSSPNLLDNLIEGNEAHAGGGIWCNTCSSPTVVGNRIIENSVTDTGGGLFFESYSNPVLTCNLLCGNQASQGGGICGGYGGTITVTNTILWDNEASVGPELCLNGPEGYSGILIISLSNVKGGASLVHADPFCTVQWGVGMIDSNPLFVDPASGDFHLTFQSPCRGSGNNDAPEMPDHDFEGDPRIHQGVVDMGADEFYPHLYCTGNFNPGGQVEGKISGLPGTWPMGLFIGSGILETPLQHKWGEFYLDSPWYLYTLVPISGNGVLSIPTTLPTTPVPYDIPMQALIGLDLSNLFVLEVR